jgi:hypothetical protein
MAVAIELQFCVHHARIVMCWLAKVDRRWLAGSCGIGRGGTALPSVIESPMLGTTTSSTASRKALNCKLRLGMNQLGCACTGCAGCFANSACCNTGYCPICHARSRTHIPASREVDRSDILEQQTACREVRLSDGGAYDSAAREPHPVLDPVKLIRQALAIIAGTQNSCNGVAEKGGACPTQGGE